MKQGTFKDNRSYRFYVKQCNYSDVVNAYRKTDNRFITDGKTTDDKGNTIDMNQLMSLKKASQLSSDSADAYKGCELDRESDKR
ncbi:hypothetical protein P4S72_29675 [Vibrio sp. PP-XX7]